MTDWLDPSLPLDTVTQPNELISPSQVSSLNLSHGMNSILLSSIEFFTCFTATIVLDIVFLSP